MPNTITNLAILAHIDAGKTTLSERLLFLCNKISAMGLVEEGLATMDYLAEEKRRGITIEAGYSSFKWRDRSINFVDTPGHVDFGVEVDCALDCIEAGVLVISGVRRIQTQTYSAWHKLEERQTPTIVFINKLDNIQADVDETLIDFEMAFESKPLVLSYPFFDEVKGLHGVIDVISKKWVISEELSRNVEVKEVPKSIRSQIDKFYNEIIEFCAENDEAALNSHLADEQLSTEQIFNILSIELKERTFTPIYTGSAKTMDGVRLLLNGMRFLVPSFVEHQNPRAYAQVLKIRNSQQFGRFYLVKAFKVLVSSEAMNLYKLDGETLEPTQSVEPGDLVALICSPNFRIGDEIDWNGKVVLSGATPTYNPLIQVQIEAKTVEQQKELKKALEFFLESDPSMKLEYQESSGTWKVSTIGEVHLQVLIARLEDEFNLEVNCGNPEIQKLEKWIEPQLEFQFESTWNENSMSLSFSIEPFSRQEVEWNYYGKLKQEELVRAVMQSAVGDFARAGFLGSGKLVNARINLSNLNITGVLVPGMLKKLVLDGLNENVKPSQIILLEPFMDMELITPEEFSGKITADLKSRNAKIQGIESDGKYNWIRCEIPLVKTFGYTTWLRDISQGRASYGLQYHDHKPQVTRG